MTAPRAFSLARETMVEEVIVQLRGCFRILFLYDVAEAFDGDKLQALLGPSAGAVRPGFTRRTPDYVRFSHPPILDRAEPVTLETGERLECSIKYYTFAVVGFSH